MHRVTLTIPRPDEDITVVLQEKKTGWVVVRAIDEDGESVKLSLTEEKNAILLAEEGVDETGV